MKPVDPAELLKTIKSKLALQQQTEQTTKEKLARWINEQARKASAYNFKGFLEQAGEELATFGLTKTQAKTYVTLLALGIASASEIADTSKIRREEVYRMLPELEKRGLVVRKLKSPRKYASIEPEMAIQRLLKTKLKAMTTEIDRLSEGQGGLVSRLREVELPLQPDDCSVDVITDHDTAVMKLLDMTQKAQRQIDVIAPLEELRNAYANRPKNLRERLLGAIKIRGIVDSNEFDSLTEEILLSAEASGNPIELRHLGKLPFHLLIVDDKAAMWGGLRARSKASQDFWTNDPTQISVLKTSFESLWQKSLRKKGLRGKKPIETAEHAAPQP
jgi:sugar-specific transcriptional regulator TrmB